MDGGNVTPQNNSHLVKLERIIFQTSEEQKLCDQAFDTARLAHLRYTYMHTYGRTYTLLRNNRARHTIYIFIYIYIYLWRASRNY